MIIHIEKRHTTLGYKILCSFIAVTFLSSVILPPTPVFAQTVLNLPVPGTMLPPSPGFMPVLMTGLTIHPDNPLRFDFIMDTGHSGLDINSKEFKKESEKLIKYFMASLTTPEEELWVNLSPYEKDHMIPQGLGDTEMGQDMLAQDYLLKQLTASLMYPEEELGKEFWDKVYQKAKEKFGTTEIPLNTFNKIWIVPEDALVYEQDGSTFVIHSQLAVMLEEDYEALRQSKNTAELAPEDTVVSGLQSQVVREVLIPEITKEINEGKNFANLRQIFNALILATWYKVRLKESLLGKVYVDQSKTKGIDSKDKQINEKIYTQYLEAFKKGVYNYIREDYDESTRQIIPRKYFSGGVSAAKTSRGKWLSRALLTGWLVLGLAAFSALPSWAQQKGRDVLAGVGGQAGVTAEFVENSPDDVTVTVHNGKNVRPLLLAQGAATVRIEGAPVDPAGVKFEGNVYIYNHSGQPVRLSEQAGQFFPKTPEGKPLVKDTVIVIKPSADAVVAASPIVSSSIGQKLIKTVLALAAAGIICLSGCGGPGSTTPPTEINIVEPISVRDVLSWERSQQDSRTGLVETYDNTTDSILWNQASTYDQALAVITNMLGGDIESARKIMDFFVQNWDSTHGFVNFYVTSTGLPGIQKALAKHQGSRVHSGPNLWIGIAAVALYEVTGDVRYLNLAVDVANWIATVVPHDANGGIAMGPADDAVPWTKIYSTEHNLDYAALLRKLLAKQDKLTTAEKDLFEAEWTGAKRWIKARYNPGTGILDRGLNDATKSLDAATLFILTFGPQAIQDEFGIDPDQLIAKAEEHFGVTVAVPGIQGTVSGFDFTDPDFRGPVIWFEGTGQMAAVYGVMAKWHETLDNDKMAANYRTKKDFYKTQIDKVKREYPDGREAVPYASERAKTFSDGWYTPSNGPDGKPAVSVSGSSWRVISDGTYNPMAAKEEVSSSPVVNFEINKVLGIITSETVGQAVVSKLKEKGYKLNDFEEITLIFGGKLEYGISGGRILSTRNMQIFIRDNELKFKNLNDASIWHNSLNKTSVKFQGVLKTRKTSSPAEMGSLLKPSPLLRRLISLGLIFFLSLPLLPSNVQALDDAEAQRIAKDFAKGIASLADPYILAPSHYGHPGFENVTFLYDAAIHAALYKVSGDQKRAEATLDYFFKKLRTDPLELQAKANLHGLIGIIQLVEAYDGSYTIASINNALDRSSQTALGRATLEFGTTPGPMDFLGLIALYVNPKKYLNDAIHVGNVIRAMQRRDGGVVRGTMNREKVDSEPHFDSIALFAALEKFTGDPQWKKAREAAQEWARKNVVQQSAVWQGILGVSPGQPNKTFAVDGHTWTFGGVYGEDLSAQTLERYAKSVLEKALVQVTLPLPDGREEKIITVNLVDFTDPLSIEAQGVREGIHPQGSPEWTGGLILQLQKLAVAFKKEGNQKQAVFYKALAELFEDNAAKGLYRLPGREGLYTFYATGQWLQTGAFDEKLDDTLKGWYTPYWYYRAKTGEKILGASQIGGWWLLPALGVNPLNPGDDYFKTYETIAMTDSGRRAAQAYIEGIVSKPGHKYTETMRTGVETDVPLPEPQFYNARIWEGFEEGDSKKIREWAEKIIAEDNWIRIAVKEQQSKKEEVGGIIAYPWDTTYPRNEHPLHDAIWRYPLLNEVSVAYWALATVNFEAGNKKEAKKWMRKIIEEVPYHQIADGYWTTDPKTGQRYFLIKGYWNALISWEFNPGNVHRDAQMGVPYREVLREMGLRSAAPKEISIKGLKFAPPSTLDTQGKPQTQEAPSQLIPSPESQKGKGGGDVQTDKEVMSYLEQINIADPGAAKRSRPFQKIVSMGQRAEATLVRVIQNHELAGDPLKWAAYLLGVVGSYDVAKPVLESVIESPSYPWYVQVEARNGLDVLEERFQKQDPKKKPSKGDVGIEQTVLSYLKQLTIPDPTAAKDSRAFREIVALGGKAEPTLVRVIQNHELAGDPLKWAAYLLGVVGSYEVAKPVLESVIHDPSYPWYVQEEAKNGLQILLRRKAAGQAGSKENDSKTIEFAEEIPSTPVSSPVGDSRQSSDVPSTTLGTPFGRSQQKKADDPDVPIAESRDSDRAQSSVGADDGGLMTNPGGIDLNPALLDLQIKRDGNGVPLPLPMQPIENMHIEGFLPVIINIVPITNLPLLLGLDLPAQQENPVQLTYQELSLAVPPARERFHSDAPAAS